MDLPLLRLIDRAKEFVGSQLREFMSLDKRTGKFDTVPEYPEFAWLEGIVNAVTLRSGGQELLYKPLDAIYPLRSLYLCAA